jgi:uncharacterized protein YndB with AHSA1/START domain
MARVKRTFEMQVAPETAQAMFVRDITPDMHRVRGFVLVHEEPGHLVYSDDLPDPIDTIGAQDQRLDALPYLAGPLSRGRHVRVAFTSTTTGTSVEISGHAERDLHDALERLGTPGHWPETAGEPHA